MPGFYPRNEYRPDTVTVVNRHGMTAAVPVIEVTDYAYCPGVGRPHGKTGTFGSLVIYKMGTQHVVNVPMPAFGKQVQVELTQGGAFHRPQIPEQKWKPEVRPSIVFAFVQNMT